MNYAKKIERWDIFEVSVLGNNDGNPFVDYQIKGTFKSKNEEKTVSGFYDGGGIYRVRFMPSFSENYSFEIKGNFSNEVFSGSFTVLPAQKNNHGPARIDKQYHFAYEDGTPYYPFGTTCYVWNLQSDELIDKTLQTLKNNAFNKIRFCVFPKHYDYNLNEPRSYPYIGKPVDSSVLTKENFTQYNGNPAGNDWNFKCFNTAHFRHIEKCISALRDLNIEADLILMHPYDRWGFSLMDAECDNLYLNYVIARFSAYRNIWWSLANEYDLMPQKKISDWERYAQIICENDVYNHLRSIHNCRPFYDHSRPWITHCSIQRQDIYKCAELASEYRERYKKPVVLDEIAYEGNIEHGWGNISGKEITRRFWEAFLRGAYAGHGETFLHPENVLWWSRGGELRGESPARIAFLRRILEEIPARGLSPFSGNWDEIAASADGGCYIFYYSFMRPSFREFYFDDSTEYRVSVIDTWDMNVEDRGVHKGKFKIELPGKEYMAVLVKKGAI